MTENEAILIMDGSKRDEHLYMYDAEDRPYLIARAENIALNALKENDIPIIHGKAELELHDNGIRNKAIDEFAEKFIYKAVCEGCSGCCGCYEESKQSECEDWKAYMEVAQQLKGGANE